MAIRALVLLLALLTVACFPRGAPTYPVDFYPELHYSQGSRPQEPPRIDPPAGAVPISGATAPLEPTRVATIRNPIPTTPENQARAAELLRVNCRACHGPEGHGDGFLVSYFQRANMATPVDFRSDRVRGRTDGELYVNISNGIVTGTAPNPDATLGIQGMPPFGKLLSSEERWLLVGFVRSVGGQGR